MMMPIMTPKSPRALPKIWTMSMLTKVEGVCAWARAVPEPMHPTESPQHRLLIPTTKPMPKTQYAENCACCQTAEESKRPPGAWSLFWRIIATMTP